MRCERHHLALAPDGTCILCRKEGSAQSRPQSRRGARLVVLLAILLLLTTFVVLLVVPRGAPVARVGAGSRASIGTLRTTYTTGRSGTFFVPDDPARHPLPLLVLLHGTGGSGATAIGLVTDLAIKRAFAVVAPDSEFADHWDVPDHSGETTRDAEHVIACVREVLAMTDVTIDRRHVLIVGISGGGSTAPYEASTHDEFTAFAVLHGGAFAGGLGPRRVPGWFSTGESDPLRPVASVEQSTAAVRAVGFDDVVMHTYPGGHSVSPIELHELVEWWLAK